MKSIFFKQQKPFDYIPLLAGLGYITKKKLNDWWWKKWRTAYEETLLPEFIIDEKYPELCPKIYTTRTHKLEGEYYVVEGSRFKPKPVEPRIEFKVGEPWRLDLRNRRVKAFGDWIALEYVFPVNFPELDLGIRGAIFEDLRNELLRLNPKVTLDTPFWINKLEPIRGKS